jgi:SpoIID/LytB domain protein
LTSYGRTAPSIRGMIRILLPILSLASFSCGPPRPTPLARGAEPPAAPSPLSTSDLIWRSRSRAWDRLRVGLTHLPDHSPLTARPARAAKLFDVSTGNLLGRVAAGAPVMLSAGPGETVRFVTTGVSGAARALRLETEADGFRLEGHRHAGALLCWRAGERVACAVDTPLEAYLLGVVPGEVPSAWPLETQKALAVAARTYAQVSRGKHAAEGFDVCDGTHCQMYLGRVPGAARSERAVRETQGLVALSAGQPIRAFYSADCGGRTANNEDVPFPDNPAEPQPYLRSVPDKPWPGGPDYCARSPHHHWSRLLTAEQIETAFNSDPATTIGKLRDLQITEVDSSGRAKTIEVKGELPAEGPPSLPAAPGSVAAPSPVPHARFLNAAAPMPPTTPVPDQLPTPGTTYPQRVTRTMPGYAFRRAIGPRRLKSTYFTLTAVSPGRYRFSGSGYGHGVGLCQIGARTMAQPPYRRTFRQILAHYYHGVTIAPFRPAEPPQ